jgi:hypothetical protein
MALNVGELYAKLGLDDREFNAKLGGAHTGVQGFADRCTGAFRRVALGGVVTAGAFAGVSGSVDRTGGSLQRLSDRAMLMFRIVAVGTVVAVAMVKLARAFGSASAAATNTQQATDSLIRKLTILGVAAGAAGALVKLSNSFRQTGSSADSAREKIHGFSISVLNHLRNIGLAAGGIAIAGGVAGLKLASDWEQATLAFTNMLHSGEKANSFMGALQEFAAKTPFELPGLIQGARRLMAFGINARNVLPDIEAIGDAVSAMGGSADMIDRVTMAIGQMQAKGKV